MRITNILILMIVSIMGCNEQHSASKEFISEKITKTASFIVDETIDKVFPLFGAFEERKWIPTWKPVLIYPDKEIIEEGTTFKIKTHGYGHDSENEFLWIVIKYEPEDYLIQYLVSTPNRFWTITVKSHSIDRDTKTNTTVTYAYTGLNTKGNTLNKESMEQMYKNDLRDWGDAINDYFQSIKKQ